MHHSHLMDDKDLVRLYLKGDESAFSILLSRHKQRIFATIFFMVRNHELAEDLFQETFIKIIISLRDKKYNEENKFLPWAVRIAHNLVIDHFRKSKKKNEVHETEEYKPLSRMTDGSLNAAEKMIHEEVENSKTAYVRKYIDLLPQNQREVIILKHYAGLSFKEIASILNININTALGRMHYGVKEMRRMMTGSEEMNENTRKMNLN